MIAASDLDSIVKTKKENPLKKSEEKIASLAPGESVMLGPSDTVSVSVSIGGRTAFAMNSLAVLILLLGNMIVYYFGESWGLSEVDTLSLSKTILTVAVIWLVIEKAVYIRRGPRITIG